MYVYIKSEPQLFTVGFYRPDGKFESESDHSTREEAAKRVHYLNGATDEPQECAEKSCAYQTHYLVHHDPAVNGPRLEHAAYHEAEKRCAEAQQRYIDWLEAHQEDNRTPVPEHLERQAQFWERKVCA